MAQDIVACSGCGKKFRIPDGSPPSGKFACTACGADVAWGGAVAGKGSSGGGSSKGARPKTGSRAAKAKARASAKADGETSRGARRARGRRSRDAEPAGEGDGGRRGHLPKEKENKTLPLIAAIMGIVLLIGILIVAFTGETPDYDKQAAEAPPITSVDSGNTGDGGSGLSAGDGNGTSESPSGDSETPAADTDVTTPIVPLQPEDAGGEDEESGIGGSQTQEAREKDYRYWFLRPLDELFTDVPPIEGTTDEEAAEYSRLAALATDFDAGATGMKAEGQLAKVGRKAVPFLISQFAKAWNGSKWEEPNEQFACSKIQQLAREITKADGPPSELFVRFPPGPGVDASKYKRAARMWTAWWRGEGQFIEKFKSYEDEE